MPLPVLMSQGQLVGNGMWAIYGKYREQDVEQLVGPMSKVRALSLLVDVIEAYGKGWHIYIGRA